MYYFTIPLKVKLENKNFNIFTYRLLEFLKKSANSLNDEKSKKKMS